MGFPHAWPPIGLRRQREKWLLPVDLPRVGGAHHFNESDDGAGTADSDSGVDDDGYCNESGDSYCMDACDDADW